jgi:hypothetical protein
MLSCPLRSDCIEEIIEIILSDIEEIQVCLQFLPDVAKKICESLKRPRDSPRGNYSQYLLQLDGQNNQDGSGRGIRCGTQETEGVS